MKRAKLLSLFLAGSLLFQTAGIDAMATAPSEPVPVSETVEDVDNGLSEQPFEEESESKESTEEENDSEQSSVEEEGKDSAVEDENSEQLSDEEDEEKDAAGEEGDPEQPSDEENEGNLSDEEEGDIKDSISENTVSENTISENTLPEDEASIFSIFPGLGDNYKFSSQQLADKRVLASHVGDVVQIHSLETATIADFKDVSDNYEPGEVVYLAETKEEAEQVAKAFGGTLESYSYEVAVISLPEKATVALAIAAAAEPDIKLPAVWPNYYQYLHTDTNSTVNPLNPSDPGFDEQWQHDYIGTRYAWAAGFKGQDIKVAVIDTGIQVGHEDLNVKNVYNFVGGKSDSGYNKDNDEHGTHVAGIIAAAANNKGGVGIAPDAQVTGYCVFPAGGGADSSDVIRAINAAVGMEADGKKPENPKNDIINMSLGSPQYDANYEKVVKNAYEAGVAIFASSGNDDTDGNNFPAAYASTISVGAVDQNSTRASFSNYGKTVTLSFPGVAIYSTIPTNSYDYMDGTSQASPAAAGTAAVILSARKDIRDKTGKARVDALLAAMKSSTTKCAGSGMGAGTTYLPGVLKLATDMTAPETPVINVVNEADYERGKNKKDYIAESIKVTLSSDTAVGVDIYYSTDGKTPTYKNGEITNAESTTPYTLGTEITLTGAKSKTIKAIAVNPFSGKVSKVASKTVTLTPIPTGVTVSSVDGIADGKAEIAAGKSLKLTAAVTPSYAISNKVTWTVDATTAQGITVSNGTVKTKTTTAPGIYIVTATATGSNGKPLETVKGTYTFKVIESTNIKKVAFVDSDTKKAPTAKSIKTTDSTIIGSDNNETLDLKNYLVVTTTDAATKQDTDLSHADSAAKVFWSSSNTKVATVSDGVISAVGPGKATIKAISNDGGNKSASYSVTVVQPVTEIKISGPTKVAAGKGIALTATVEPANASNKKLDWTVVGSDDKVSIGKSNGKISTKKGASGEYTVTATAADKLGGATAATYKISIAEEEITKITLNEKKLTMFPPNTSAKKKTTATLTATVEGKVGANTKAEVLTQPLITWTSSAPSIASVSNGVITAKAPGKATITCAATDGSNKKATCTVTVSVPMSKLVIGPTDGNEGVIAVGKKIKMAAKYYSNYGTPTNKKISWEISSYSDQTLKDKVKIDKNGTVSVDKNLKLPSTNAYIEVRATAQDESGVTSDSYPVYIKENYLAILMDYVKSEGVMIVGLTASGDVGYVPDYCTVTVSGSKNCGLSKSRFRIKDDPTNSVYASYSPVPTKRTTNPAFGNTANLTWSIIKKEAEKITLTAKLKDGSNLSTKFTMYAVYYVDAEKEEHLLYFWE